MGGSGVMLEDTVGTSEEEAWDAGARGAGSSVPGEDVGGNTWG